MRNAGTRARKRTILDGLSLGEGLSSRLDISNFYGIVFQFEAICCSVDTLFVTDISLFLEGECMRTRIQIRFDTSSLSHAYSFQVRSVSQ